MGMKSKMLGVRILLCIFLVFLLNLRVKAAISNTKECEKVNRDYNKCTEKAYDDYRKALDAGDDGQHDWKARKACNYAVATIQECGDILIGDCNTEEVVTAMKKNMMKDVLEQFGQVSMNGTQRSVQLQGV